MRWGDYDKLTDKEKKSDTWSKKNNIHFIIVIQFIPLTNQEDMGWNFRFYEGKILLSHKS